MDAPKGILGIGFAVTLTISLILALVVAYSDFENPPTYFTARSFVEAVGDPIPEADMIGLVSAPRHYGPWHLANVAEMLGYPPQEWFPFSDVMHLPSEERIEIKIDSTDPHLSRELADYLAKGIVDEDFQMRNPSALGPRAKVEQRIAALENPHNRTSDPDVLADYKASIVKLKRQLASMPEDPKQATDPHRLVMIPASIGKPNLVENSLETHLPIITESFQHLPPIFLACFAIYLVSRKISGIQRGKTAGSTPGLTAEHSHDETKDPW